MCHEAFNWGWGQGLGDMVLEACPFLSCLQGLVVFTVFRCEAKGISTYFSTLT